MNARGPASGEVKGLLAFFAQRLLASPVTLTLIATCVLLDVLSRLWGPGHWRDLALWHMGKTQWTAVLDGEVYRLFTGAFLHRDASHLFGNVFALLVSGLLLEPALGGRRFMLLYTASDLAGALAYLPGRLQAAVMGASGAIYGVKWALMGFRLRLHSPFPLPLGKPAYVAVQVCALLAGGPLLLAGLVHSRRMLGIAVLLGVWAEVQPPRNFAHLSGGLAGLLLSYALVIRPRHMQKLMPPGSSFLSFSAGLAWAASLGSIGIAIAVGQPWRVKNEPPLATVRLEHTPFAVDLPKFSGRRPRQTDDPTLLLFVPMPHGAPVDLSISISTKRVAMSAQESVNMVLEHEAEREGDDDERSRTVQSTRVGVYPAVRIDAKHDDRVMTHIALNIGGYSIWVNARRVRSAAEEDPPVWEGIEERVAASFRIVDK